MTRSFNFTGAQSVLSTSAAHTHASTRPANTWPTKRAFYANYFHTGIGANGVSQ